MTQNTNAPTYDFTVDPLANAFSVTAQEYIDLHPVEELNLKYRFLAAAACVIDDQSPPRTLLIQRAESDSMPGRWEIPGGACDDEDPTVLHSVVRECWEESGLIPSRVGPQIGDGHVFWTRSGRLVRRFTFLAIVKPGEDGNHDVKLDPKEHQAFVWATEDEVKAYRAQDINLKFTNGKQRETILQAFSIKRNLTSPTSEP